MISTSLLVSRQARGIEHNLIDRGEAFVYSLAKTAEEGIMAESLDLLDKSAYIVDADDVELIQVYATTWDAIDAHPFERLQDPPLPEAKEHFKASDAGFFKRTGNTYDFYSAVTYKASPGNPAVTIGFARIVFSTDRMQAAITKTLFMGIAVAACLTIVSIIIVNIVVRRLVVDPVARLDHSMSLFKNGRSSDELPVASDDEVGRLAEAFNSMRRTLQEKEGMLRDREKHITLLLNSIAEGIYGVDLQGTCTFCNPAGLRILGYERAEEIVGKKIHPLIHHTLPDGTHYHSKDCKVYCSYREGKGVHVVDEVFWRSDGTSFPVEYRAQPIMRDGAPIGAVTAFTDITERKQAEEALRESEHRFRDVLENISLIGVMLDTEGRIILCSKYLLSLTGWKEEEVLNRRWFEMFLPPEVRAEIEEKVFLKSIGTGELPVHYENSIITRQGERRLIDWSNTVFRDKSGAVTGLASIGEDITERRQLEAQLRHSQKMESIGTLAGGVAHDFNNILSAISGYGHLTIMKMTPGDPHRSNIQQILEAADRAAHLTRDLLLFSRKQPIDRKSIDLNEAIQKLGKFLVRVIGEDISFKTLLSGGTIPILADSNQIGQVLMNLATNARDAMTKGGIFTIATEQVLLDDEFVKTHGFGTPGKYALIAVSDTGNGMDAETRRRIFEPFFTTKEVGKGTGLGLSVVYGIVKQHDGLVNVYSEPGYGTTFRIYLPIVASGVDEAEAGAAEEQLVGGTETILLAEDDKTVREMTRLMLQDFGYTVVTADDGIDAVKKFRENRDSIQLLLFDLIMPKKNGRDAYDEIREMRPDIKVIFTSGYDPDMVRQKALLEQNVPVVYKPVSMATLLKKVRATLGG